jgi:hypothetical protein
MADKTERRRPTLDDARARAIQLPGGVNDLIQTVRELLGADGRVLGSSLPTPFGGVFSASNNNPETIEHELRHILAGLTGSNQDAVDHSERLRTGTLPQPRPFTPRNAEWAELLMRDKGL